MKTKATYSRPENGWESDRLRAKKHLVSGATYTVDLIDEGSWHTDVYLEEFPDISFNSVMFDITEEN